MTYTAVGHTVGVAARMEAIAPPGSTVVSARTEALVRGEFDLVVLHENATIRGTIEPHYQRVFELRGPGPANSRLEVKGTGRELSGFVGRASERAALDAALDRAVQGAGSVVTLVGDPGVGKSRLVRELTVRCDQKQIATVQARAVAHGRRTPLLPVLDLLRSAFGVTDDAPQAARGRIATAMRGLSSSFEPDLPLMWDFLGIADPERPTAVIDPEARERRLVELVAQVVRARGGQEPLLLVLEDLHWLDDASGAFVAEIARSVTGARVLLVLTRRPEHAGTADADQLASEIVLEPLPRAVIAELLGEALGGHPSVRALSERIADRAGGNPFFCQDLVQAMIDEGRLTGRRGRRRLVGEQVDVVLPATVQATLAARIDGLGDQHKELLLVASVIGEATDRRLLDAVSGIDGDDLVDTLEQLVASHLMAERLEAIASNTCSAIR